MYMKLIFYFLIVRVLSNLIGALAFFMPAGLGVNEIVFSTFHKHYAIQIILSIIIFRLFVLYSICPSLLLRL